MSTVHNGARPREIVVGRPNSVLSVAEVKVLAFRFTNSEGQVDAALALCFGKDNEDGGPGVYVVDSATMKQLLKVPLRHLKEGVRQHLAAMAAPKELPVEEIAGDVDIGDFELPEKEG